MNQSDLPPAVRIDSGTVKFFTGINRNHRSKNQQSSGIPAIFAA
jgi:hypothetical protein